MKTKYILLALGCLLLMGAGCQQDLKESGITVVDGRNASASNNTIEKGAVEKIVSAFENYNSSTPIVNVQFTNTLKKPICEINTRRVVLMEASNDKKEVVEEETEYDTDGREIRHYYRHEIPQKSVSGLNMIIDRLIGQTPYFVLLIIALVCIGVVIYAKFFRGKK